MALQNLINKKIVLPASDTITGWGLNKSLSFLDKSQWWSKDQLLEFQLQRLQQLIAHAYRHTVYYKNMLDEIGLNPQDIKTIQDLKKLPVISKQQFRNAFPEQISSVANDPGQQYMPNSTSGSTGQQLNYYISKQAYGMINAAALRGWNWMGFELGDKYLKISQNKRSSFLKRLQDKINNCRLVTCEYTPQGMEEILNELNSFQPKILRSYPDPLMFLCQHIKGRKLSFPYLSAINTTGNILTKEARELIEKTFGVPVFDSYSCEGSTQVFECPTHNYYHLADEYAITEILDEKGNEVKEGERGLLVTTDLWNFASPFIRYNSLDYVIKGGNCSCGRQLSTIKQIDGRDNDVLITPLKQYLIAQTFTTYFKYFDEIAQFQVVQESDNSLLFRLITNQSFSSVTEEKIIEYWKTYTKNSMNIAVEVVNEIPLRPSGKRQFLIRKETVKLPG